MTNAGAGGLAAQAAAVLLCVLAHVPDRVVDALPVRGWVIQLVVIIAVVNGARVLARAPFSASRARGSIGDWIRGQLRELALTAVVGSCLTVPFYALLRTGGMWWFTAWLLFAAITLAVQAAMPFVMPLVLGGLTPAPRPLAAQVGGIAATAGVHVERVLVAAKPGRRCNAYIVGIGQAKRVVLDGALAEWPAPIVSQVVAHEIGHVRLGHVPRRLAVTVAVELMTFVLAAWPMAQPGLLDHWAGVAEAGDPRSYPVLLLLTPLLVFPARAVLAWYDRRQERQADRFALDLLEAPEDFVTMLDRAACESDAPRVLSWPRRVVASHPPIAERVMTSSRSWPVAD